MKTVVESEPKAKDETNVFPTCALNEFEPKVKNEFSAVGGETPPSRYVACDISYWVFLVTVGLLNVLKSGTFSDKFLQKLKSKRQKQNEKT